MLEYRWVTRSGTSSGPGRQSLAYTADGPASRQLEYTALGYRADGTLADAVRLEVQGPAPAVSDWVEFSVTCGEEAPTGGASSPGASGSPDPAASPDPAPAP
ncbi:hypothetical protein [Streptomyces sp. NPDC007369]|uniref:hypothetical protein n=1 Tax=Streptomyces sp. NPDC007369 TaxID=3154589 RepID=UPI0033EE4B17